MQRFESSRPSQPVRLHCVTEEGRSKTAMHRVVSQNTAVALVDLCRVGKRMVRAPLSSGDRGLPKKGDRTRSPLHNHSQAAGSVGASGFDTPNYRSDSEFTRRPLPSFTRSWRRGLLRVINGDDAKTWSGKRQGWRKSSNPRRAASCSVNTILSDCKAGSGRR
jgi:hypothetical protein